MLFRSSEVVHPQRGAQGSGDLARHDAVFGKYRNHEGEGSHEVRGIAQETLAFVERFVDEGDVALLQVAKSTVHEFAALA